MTGLTWLEGISGGTLHFFTRFNPGDSPPLPWATLRERASAHGVIHECLALRIEETRDERHTVRSMMLQPRYYGMIEMVRLRCIETAKEELQNDSLYTFEYHFLEERITIVFASETGKLIIPVISKSDEAVEITAGKILIIKEKATVTLESERGFELPYGKERIFHLCPGFQALRIDVPGMKEEQRIHLSWKCDE